MPVPAEEGLRRLRKGNSRFRHDSSENGQSVERHTGFVDLSAGQQPFAAVLGCSDSRVPVEMIFDQGPGQLFVVRVAGNVVGPTQLGSLEFTVAALGVRLLIVLGHTGCGAVAAAFAPKLSSVLGRVPHNLGAITGRISKTLGGEGQSVHPGHEPSPGEAERLHASAVARKIVLQSELLASAVRSGQLLITGSIYDLETGRVEFFDEVVLPLTVNAGDAIED